jgi:hypothetical protein
VAVEVPVLLEQHGLHQGRGKIRQGGAEAVLLVGAEKYVEDPPLPAGVGPGKGDAGEDIQKNGVPGQKKDQGRRRRYAPEEPRPSLSRTAGQICFYLNISLWDLLKKNVFSLQMITAEKISISPGTSPASLCENRHAGGALMKQPPV